MYGFNLGMLAIPAVILVSFFFILPIGLIVKKIADRRPNSYLSRNRGLFVFGIIPIGVCFVTVNLFMFITYLINR